MKAIIIFMFVMVMLAVGVSAKFELEQIGNFSVQSEITSQVPGGTIRGICFVNSTNSLFLALDDGTGGPIINISIHSIRLF